MVFTRSKLTPLQKIGGPDYDSDDDTESEYGGSGYESDPSGDRGDSSFRRRRKPLTYAEFLRAQERAFGPQGAIDSMKGGEGAKHFPERPVKRSRSVGSLVNALSTTKDLEEERNSQLRTIEQNIALTRAKKRDLRRLEGDLNKHQYSIRKSFKKFESVVSSRMEKKDDQLKSLNQQSAKSQQEYAHQRKEKSSTRGVENRSNQINRRKSTRKSDLQLSTVEKAYKAKLAELNLKQLEIQRITDEFTQKLKKKEEEEFRLKKELGDLSLTVAFELKKRGTLDESNDKEVQKLMRRREKEDMELESGYESSKEKSIKMKKKTENEKQLFTRALDSRGRTTNQRQRETGRQQMTTKVKMEDTGEHLHFLQKNLDTTRTDIQAISLQKRLKAAGDRKQALDVDNSIKNQFKTDRQLEEALVRAWNNEIEQRRYVMDDVKSRLEKVVTAREVKQRNLSQDVRSLGLARNNQEKQVRELEKKLEKLRLDNQRTMLQKLAESKAQERKIEDELLRKKGDLISTHAKRDDQYQTLVREKDILKKDHFVLTDIDREHKRILHVAGRTDSMYS